MRPGSLIFSTPSREEGLITGRNLQGDLKICNLITGIMVMSCLYINLININESIGHTDQFHTDYPLIDGWH